MQQALGRPPDTMGWFFLKLIAALLIVYGPSWLVALLFVLFLFWIT